VQRRYDDVRRVGGEALAVTQAAAPALARFAQDNPTPVPVVGDPSQKAYKAFGLERTSWLRMLRPGVVLRYLGLLFRGWRPRRLVAGEDVLQLGGDFVLDGQQRLVFAYRSAEPTDRPDAEELVVAVRNAAVPSPDPVS
jgi:hypothetical protein